jgi:hypothetical protein
VGDLRDGTSHQDAYPGHRSQQVNRAGVNAAAAARSAGALARSRDDQVTGIGSALSSAEMVISCAAPASNSAARRHGRLGGQQIRQWLHENWPQLDRLPGCWRWSLLLLATSSEDHESPTRLPGTPAMLVDRTRAPAKYSKISSARGMIQWSVWFAAEPG